MEWMRIKSKLSHFDDYRDIRVREKSLKKGIDSW